MGVESRDYYRTPTRGSHPILAFARTAVGAIMLLQVGVYLGQIVSGGTLTGLLAASANELRDLQVHRAVTAIFVERDDTLLPLAVNLVFLFFFGRELEPIYGRGKFLLFYLAAGTLATVAEAVILGVAGSPSRRILGSSGAVLGIVTLFTLFYPDRRILFFFVPVPVWLLCVAFIAMDIFDGIGRGNLGSLGDLTGSAVGIVSWYAHSRWRRLGVRVPGPPLRLPLGFLGRFLGRRREAKIIHMPHPARDEDSLRISSRIDEILAKISRDGKGSLTEEEWAFLRENSGRYRSEPPS